MPQTLLDPVAALGDVALEHSGTHPLRAEGVSVRAYPYPYLAALSISNDLDSMRRDAFENWHAYVNGRKPTADGDGLGLEIGDSFWVWDQSASGFALYWQRPEQQPGTDSPCLDRLIELGRAGWFDTMHSMGNWWGEAPALTGTFRFRDHAAAALERLDSMGIKPPVYVNHSMSVTNIGGPWGYYHCGDNPESPFYCLDLLRHFGCHYYWLDVCTNLEKFGDHLEYRSKDDLVRAIGKFTWANWLQRIDGNKAAPLTLPSTIEECRALLAAFFNKTLIRTEGRDGSRFFAFKRHRGFEQPVMDTFCSQVTEGDLDRLEAMRGVAIVYQHFGLSGPRGRSDALSQTRRRQTTAPVFDAHARARLRSIARRFGAGRLWVALSGRILRYLWLREALRYRVTRSDDKWLVTLTGTVCDIRGNGDLAYADLNGLALSVPHDAPEIVVTVAGRAAALPMRRVADPAWPGRDAVYLAWEPLEWPI